MCYQPTYRSESAVGLSQEDIIEIIVPKTSLVV